MKRDIIERLRSDWEMDSAASVLPAIVEIQRLRNALENVRLLASRHRTETWAGHMLRFCADAGVTGSSLREGGE